MGINPSSFYCFIHIEKCAGTTLHHSLKYNLPGYLTLRPWYYWSNEEGNYLHKDELKRLKNLYPILSGIGGHTTRTYAGYEDVIDNDIKYFTFVRNPVERYMSHFNYQVNDMDKSWTIKSFTEEKRFNNYITQRIAGTDNLSLAVDRLEKEFSFVGMVEEFNESLVMLSQFVFNDDIPLFYERKNTISQNEKVTFGDVDDKFKEKIIENNSLDIQLYKYVKNILYPKYKSDYKGDLVKNLTEFNEKNKHYSYNSLKNGLIKISKLITDRILQKMVHKFETELAI